jgi:hypothetical protein
MNRMYKYFAISLIFFFSCTKKLENPGATNTVTMSNEWWVTLSSGGTDLLGRHVLFGTYNTSQNVSDSMWLDDFGNTWDFKCKVLADPNSLTFKTTDSSQNEYYDIRVHITNGKIFPNGGVGKSTGSPVDSIYMEATFTDDPVNTYIITGVARSRWAQDDYN